MSGNQYQYRPDIDGLRAIAVLAVMLFHYGLAGLHGGFVGVDVFFVISGYLITGIIHKEIQRGEFSIARFYERRARRIFPALFVVLLCTLIAGLFVLLPGDLRWLGRSTVATLLFVSNVQYLTESGYFSDSSEFNPLLHTWSLGVEEQFYIGLPLLLLLVVRFWPNSLRWAFVGCALISFILCVIAQPISAKLTFFLSPFRAWELLLGALLGVGAIPDLASRGLRNAAAVLAIITLLGSLHLMSAGIDFPGWKAAVPVVATAVLLHTGKGKGTFVNRLLAWRPLVFVGLISYSLYLWHWPLWILVKYHGAMQPVSPGVAVLLAVIAFLLATASYYWVEQPFRKRPSAGRQFAPPRKVLAISAALALPLLAAGIGLMLKDGLPGRVPLQVAALDHARRPLIPYQKCDDILPSARRPDCRIGDAQGKPLALIWGDSHAMSLAPGLDVLLRKQGVRGVLAVNSACAPLMGLVNPKDPDCNHYNQSVMDWVKQNKPAVVYLVAAWGAWSNTEGSYDLHDMKTGQTGNKRLFRLGLSRTLAGLAGSAGKIEIVGPTPAFDYSVPYRMAMAEWGHAPAPAPLPLRQFEKRADNFWEAARPLAAQASLIDATSWFCDVRACRYAMDGAPLFRDGHHLSVAGARFAAQQLERAAEVSGPGHTAVSLN